MYKTWNFVQKSVLRPLLFCTHHHLPITRSCFQLVITLYHSRNNPLSSSITARACTRTQTRKRTHTRVPTRTHTRVFIDNKSIYSKRQKTSKTFLQDLWWLRDTTEHASSSQQYGKSLGESLSERLALDQPTTDHNSAGRVPHDTSVVAAQCGDFDGIVKVRGVFERLPIAVSSRVGSDSAICRCCPEEYSRKLSV